MDELSGQMPLAVELDANTTPEFVFRKLQGCSRRLWLDSARIGDPRNRYSFVMADPLDVFESDGGQSLDKLSEMQRCLAEFPLATHPELPPFQGGLAGYLSYELCHQLELILPAKIRDFPVPVVSFGLYDCVFAWDHQQQRGWLISTGYSPTGKKEIATRAEDRKNRFLSVIHSAGHSKESNDEQEEISLKDLAPQFRCQAFPNVFSNFEHADYLEAVQRSIDYIYAGDIFQVNIAQRLLTKATCSADLLYLKLRKKNPAPFAGFYDFGTGQIASASPERFIQIGLGEIETRPIKGTRLRTGHPEFDMYTADELKNSVKDRAENVMIVDLLRNDLSRICLPESVRVEALCGIETYETVQHLVSSIRGTLRERLPLSDLVASIFPGGSITGAPKIRAMEIISEIEPTSRGPYCGSLGYIGFDGAVDWNILIRTVIASRGWWQFPVGGGIVAKSTPQREYEETWHKASGLISAILSE